MTLLEKAERKPSKSKGITAIIIATLCTIGIAVAYFYGPRELHGIDIAVLFIIAAFVAYGSTQNTIRGLFTAMAIYLATAIGSTFYKVLAPYARSFLNALNGVSLGSPPPGQVDTPALAVSFAFAAVVLWIILEVLFRAALPGTRLTFLGPVDRVGGALVYLLVGIAVAALTFSITGYAVAGEEGYSRAALRPELDQVMALIYRIQAPWFAGNPPAVYIYN